MDDLQEQYLSPPQKVKECLHATFGSPIPL